jgi:hypothetical protein
MAAVLDIHDAGSLEAWLAGKSIQSAVAIAARAALRVAPLASSPDAADFASEMSAVFRANALARVAAKYTTGTNSFGSSKRAAAAKNAHANAAAAAAIEAAGADASPATRAASCAADAARAADASFIAAYAESGALDAASAAGLAATHAYVAAYNAYVTAGLQHAAAAARATLMWAAARTDAETISRGDSSTLADMPLWQSGAPIWAANAWSALKAALPRAQDWDVWIDWYEERLRGSSRDEDYERVFASVPKEEWDKGPSVANAWIKTKLRSTELGDRSAQIDFHDRGSFEKWLEGQEPDVPVLLATRAALRVLPASIRISDVRHGQEAKIASRLRGEAFRAIALARVSAMWPSTAQVVAGRPRQRGYARCVPCPEPGWSRSRHG